MEYFVEKQSIVREIWGTSDTILFIFAGASAEFALNKAVDWLYFTGRLPKDPIGRLFSTVSYAKMIVFADQVTAARAINAMADIHAKVEAKRGSKIPDWAYRDVLFMLIHYSIAAYEAIEHALSKSEKEEVFNAFYRVGQGMNLQGLPNTFEAWQNMRIEHLNENLSQSHYTDDLFRQYRRQLGDFRYRLLLETQKMLVPQQVADLLKFRRRSVLKPLIWCYKLSKALKIDWFLKALLLPSKYKMQIKKMDEHQHHFSSKKLDVVGI